MTNYSRSVLKSNGLRHSKNPACKVRLFVQNRSRKYRPKVTVTTLFQTAFHRVFQLLAQTAHVCFHELKAGTHSAFAQKDRTQRLTRRNTGRFGWGWYHYPRTRSARSRTSPGRVSERQTLPLLGLGRGCSRRTQKAFGTAMCLCASLFRGVAAPLGCVALLPLLVQPDLLGWKRLDQAFRQSYYHTQQPQRPAVWRLCRDCVGR